MCEMKQRLINVSLSVAAIKLGTINIGVAMATLRQPASDKWGSCSSRQKLSAVFIAEIASQRTLERAGEAPTSDRHLT